MTTPTGWKNKLYFGDNLGILRESVEKESVDLVVLGRFRMSRSMVRLAL